MPKAHIDPSCLPKKARNQVVLASCLLLVHSFVGLAHAQMELARDKHCLACHALDKKVVGPSYWDVASKYKQDPLAKDRLAQKIMKGGSGVWGVIPMPANPQVNLQEAQALASWVLQLKAP